MHFTCRYWSVQTIAAAAHPVLRPSPTPPPRAERRAALLAAKTAAAAVATSVHTAAAASAAATAAGEAIDSTTVSPPPARAAPETRGGFSLQVLLYLNFFQYIYIYKRKAPPKTLAF